MTNPPEHHTHTRRCWWDLERGGWRCDADRGTRVSARTRPGRTS